jgi:hypothetical protein
VCSSFDSSAGSELRMSGVTLMVSAKVGGARSQTI